MAAEHATVDATLDATKHIGVQFLLTDIKVALALLDRASASMDAEIRRRNVNQAQHTYDLVERVLREMILEPWQRHFVQKRLAVLADQLEDLHDETENQRPS